MPVNAYPSINADKCKEITSNKTDIPKGDNTESILIARGAPTHREVTNTDNGGKKGLIALDTLGKNLYVTKEHSCKR